MGLRAGQRMQLGVRAADLGGDRLVLMAGHAGIEALLTPVFVGLLAIVLVALAVNNLRQRGGYPRCWL